MRDPWTEKYYDGGQVGEKNKEILISFHFL